MTSTPAGWYPDGQGNERYWDGAQWTQHTRPLGTPAAPQQPAAPVDPNATQVAAPRDPGAAPYTPGAPAAPATPGWGQPQQPAQQPQQGWNQPNWGQPVGKPGGGKKVILIVAAVVAVLVVVGAVFGAKALFFSNGPDDVAKKYFDRLQDHDCDFLEALSNDNIGADSEKDRDKALKSAKSDCKDNIDENFDDDDGKGCEFDVTKSSEHGDKADVKYKVKSCDDSDDNETGTLHLIKEGGDWRIDDAD